MMLYKINYSVDSPEEFKRTNTYAPIYILALSFDEAVKTAQMYEQEGVKLTEVKLEFNGNISVADGVVRKFNSSKKEEAVASSEVENQEEVMHGEQ